LELIAQRHFGAAPGFIGQIRLTPSGISPFSMTMMTDT
jgi:hypothetical protein